MPEHSGFEPGNLPAQTGNVSVTMSSREIAELTSKHHRNVKRDIEKMLIDLGEDALKFEHTYFDSMNRQQTEYRLDRDLTENLLLGYSAPLRRKVLAKLRELENAANRPLDYSDPQVVLGVMSHLQGQIAAKDVVIALQSQRLGKLNRIEGAVGNLPITDAAKLLKVKPRFLTNFLHENRWIYKRPGSQHWLAYQRLMPKYLDHRDGHYVTEGEKHFFTYAVVTPAGVVLLAQMLEEAARTDGKGV